MEMLHSIVRLTTSLKFGNIFSSASFLKQPAEFSVDWLGTVARERQDPGPQLVIQL